MVLLTGVDGHALMASWLVSGGTLVFPVMLVVMEALRHTHGEP